MWREAEFGYKNLYKHIAEFDFTLFDNSISSTEGGIIPREILHIEKGKVHLWIKDYPTWADPVMARFHEL